MSERYVVDKTVGEPGFEESVAEVLSAVSSGDVIAVPDAAAEKTVREAAVKFGLGVDEEDVGIGIEIMAGTGGEVEFDESVLEYAVQAEDQSGFMAEVEDMVGRPDFDDQTIFVVANRREVGWLFAAVAEHPEKIGKVRCTINATNVIVTSLADLPDAVLPKLAVDINVENLAPAVVQALGNAGFAVGFKAYTGVLRAKFDEGASVPTKVWLEMPGEEVDLPVGSVGEEIRIALPVPEEDMPDLKLTGAKPKVEDGAGPQDPDDVPESGSSATVESADPSPARTEGKNVVDG